jgi:phthiocerol/phenolphthiocerol synthesis type-I polyketide synthase D
MKSSAPKPSLDRDKQPDAGEIELWLMAALASRLKVSRIDPERPLGEYGLDSMVAVRMLGLLEKWLNRSLPATLFFEYSNIRELATALASGNISEPAEYAAPDEDCY